MAHLENKSAGTTFELGSEARVIGSQDGCAVPLSGPGVSPEHAELQSGPDGFKVVDLESREGTRVNGRYVNQHTLIEGDVIRVGEHELTFRAGAQVAAPAQASTPPAAASPVVKPTRAKRSGGSRSTPARSTPSRGGPARGNDRAAKPKRAPPARSRRPARQESEPDEFDYDDFDAEAGRRERQAAKRANAKRMNVALIAIPAVLLVAFVINGLLPGQTVNTGVTSQMLDAQGKLEWARVIELSKEAEETGDFEWKRIQDLVAEAKRNLASSKDFEKVEGASEAWRDVQVWRQDNFKNNDEFVARIDAFLAQYGSIGGAVVDEAKNHRVKITGSATSALPQNAAAAWATLKDLAERTKKSGTFGETLRQADQFWQTYGDRNRQLRSEFTALQKQLHVDAGHWFGKKAYMAKHNAEQGASGKGRRILAQAVETIGLPEFEEKAAEILKEINDM